jgi:hypothetical protein
MAMEIYIAILIESLMQHLVLLQSKFFPPNFSFVFWKREFWREKFTLQQSEFTLQRRVFR